LRSIKGWIEKRLGPSPHTLDEALAEASDLLAESLDGADLARYRILVWGPDTKRGVELRRAAVAALKDHGFTARLEAVEKEIPQSASSSWDVYCRADAWSLECIIVIDILGKEVPESAEADWWGAFHPRTLYDEDKGVFVVLPATRLPDGLTCPHECYQLLCGTERPVKQPWAEG